MARSLNRAQLIGNLTRDPELRYTPSGTAVCSFSIATNRNWTTDTGEKKEEVEFHRIVAWNKLAELCSQFLTKGRKVFVEGRLTTRSWAAQDGTQKQTTEIIINDMILLDNRRSTEESVVEEPTGEEEPKAKPAKKAVKEEEPAVEVPTEDEVAPDDIPF
jgi:single-strand DNA-binding protein